MPGLLAATGLSLEVSVEDGPGWAQSNELSLCQTGILAIGCLDNDLELLFCLEHILAMQSGTTVVYNTK